MIETQNDPVRQLHKMIRVPCNARNVDDTHTPQTAYFEYNPEEITHGKIVCCSHKNCRESGRQFRFCKICNKVCAKRNFSSRHSHMNHNERTLEKTNEKMATLKAGAASAISEQGDTKNGSEEPWIMMRVSRAEARLLEEIRRQSTHSISFSKTEDLEMNSVFDDSFNEFRRWLNRTMNQDSMFSLDNCKGNDENRMPPLRLAEISIEREISNSFTSKMSI